MIDRFTFQTNSLLVPPTEAVVSDEYKLYFAEKGTIVERIYLFEDVFGGDYDYLRVVPLADFDPNDNDLINKAIDDYEENAELYEDSIYEIARLYH